VAVEKAATAFGALSACREENLPGRIARLSSRAYGPLGRNPMMEDSYEAGMELVVS
jgi:hypothetical protein